MAMIDLIIFGSVALFMGVVFLLLNGSGEKKKLESRLKHLNEKVEASSESPSLSIRREQEASMGSIGTQLANRIHTAGLSMSVHHYLLISIIIALLTIVIMHVMLSKPLVLALLAACTFGVGLPHIYVGMKLKQRQKQFLKLFPDAIELIVRGLRAGLPVSGSMQTVAEEIAEPVGPVFEQLNDQVQLGIPMEKALHEIAHKLGLTEFDFFVTSITLQRETGGNLGEILSNLAEVLRQRHIMKLKIVALSSEARASAIIVGALPFVVVFALMFMSPDYMVPLVDDVRGNIAAAGAACSLALGVFIMMRMAKFEI